MNYSKILVSLSFLLSFGITAAQNANVFLSRDYWKTNPSIENVEQNIAKGNDISALNSSAFDAVVYAILEKTNNQTIQYLLTKEGNDVNKLTHDGRTYIFWAAYSNNLPIMKYLLSKGAKTDVIDSHGYSVMNFAASTGQQNTKIYDFLFENGANIHTEKNHNGANALLLITPNLKAYNLIDYFVSKGADLNTTDNNGNGIFNYAAKTGNIKLMNLLIKKGVSYKKLSNEGENAMIFASQGTRRVSNTLETFTYLESLGIKPNIITKKGITPLHAISYNGKDIDIYTYFISKGVDVNQKDENGNTPFLNAAQRNDLKIIQFLSTYVNDINTTNLDGKSALTNAVSRNTPEVIRFLLDQKATISIKDKKGNNLGYYLITSFSARNPEITTEKLELLVKNGFNPKEIQEDGNTLFHLAIDKNNIKLLELVNSLKIDVNSKNKEGLTALHLAIMKAKNDKIIKYLISIGADKNIETAFNESTYDLAKENELLKKQHIDITFLK